MLVAEDEPAFRNLALKLMLIVAFASRPRSFANDLQRQLFSSRSDDCDDRQ
jgi:hypothetical protein